MIKKSLTRKLIVVFSAILIAIITLIMVFNSLLLSRVYRNKKIGAMETLHQSLFAEYQQGPDTDIVIEIVKGTLINENLRVFIWDNENKLVIDSFPLSYEDDEIGDNMDKEPPQAPKQQPNDRAFGDKQKNFRFGRMEMFLFDTEIKEENLISENENYTIFSFLSFDNYEEETLCLRGYLPGEYKLLIQMPYAPIDEAIAITNTILLIVGTVMLIIGIIIVAITSRTIAKPVKELSQIAKAMEALDFTKKHHSKGMDEISSLGDSINSLSSKLESTINELREKNEQLLSDIELKSKIDTQRKEFIANASHELKTPLALISGYAEGLRDNIADSAEARELYTDVIIEEAGKMDKIIRQMLDLMELDGEDKPMDIRLLNLSDIVSEALDSFDLVFKSNKISVEKNFVTQGPFEGDRLRISQAVSNFIANAINHVDEKKFIKATVTDESDKIRFSLFNSGAQIPESDMENIWERFYKVDKAHTREYGGSGLGLSIVRSIIELHSGEYGALNHPDGVEFYFTLPKYKENNDEL